MTFSTVPRSFLRFLLMMASSAAAIPDVHSLQLLHQFCNPSSTPPVGLCLIVPRLHKCGLLQKRVLLFTEISDFLGETLNQQGTLLRLDMRHTATPAAN